MAEGLLGGVLGEEDEKPQSEATEALAGAEAFAAAVAAIASRQDPKVADRTADFLIEQARLLRLQARHLDDEHSLRLTHLAHQSHLLLGQRVGQVIRIAFQVAIALVVIVIGAGIAVMLHDAFTSRSVVIDAFDAPAALAARGVTGTVVASGVLDELTRLQNATRGIGTSKAKRALSNGWSNEVKIDVPETGGISLGEISRLLKARFGHDLHIGGDLIETDSGGLALTVRGGDFSAKTFTGGAGELDALVVDAAQYVYASSQPGLWALYLWEAGRCPEAVPFIHSEYARADPALRSRLLHTWANCVVDSGGSRREALQLERTAIRLSPDFWFGYQAEQELMSALGDEEGAWRTGEALRKAAGGRPGKADQLDFATWDDLTDNLQTLLDTLGANRQANLTSNSPRIAQIEIRLHDPAAARLTLQAAPADDRSQPRVAAQMHYTRGLLAQETGDGAQAAAEMEAFATASADAVPSFADRCWIAPIEEVAGRPDRADAALRDRATEAARIGGHFVDCERFRGDILDHRGDWTGAQQAYAAAVALAPDLPAGYYSWGVALARHGDLAGALAKLEAASERGPHWADPLKAWGDVLAKQGQWGGALAQYEKALKYAPNWTALQQALAAAAKAAD